MKVTEAQLVASLTRASFKDFVREFWHTVIPEPLVWNWHMTVLCNELQTAFERIFRNQKKEYDQVFNFPPGTSKSTIFSVMALPWAWTRFPTFRYIGVSYAHPLALQLSRKSRDVVKSELYRACFPEIVLRPDQDAKHDFANTKGGERYAAGSQGSVQGMHAHYIGIDDPIDPNKVVSEAELFATNEWIRHTLSGRKVDHRVTVTGLIMQRLHQDDPTAQMLQRKDVRWICLPAETDYPVKPESLKKYYKKGLMDPVRLPREVLEEKRLPSGLGEYGYAGQYGQSPVPAGGGIFKTDMLKTCPLPRRWKRIVRFWDKAATDAIKGKRVKAAWTVGVKMGIDEFDRIVVADVIRVRLDSFNRERLMYRTAVRDGKGCEIGIEEEGGSGGKDSALMSVRRLRGWRVRLIKAQSSKEIRADEFSVQVNAGEVHLPEHLKKGQQWTGWAADYVDELKHWPFSTYRDQGDASGGAHSVLTKPLIRVGALS